MSDAPKMRTIVYDRDADTKAKAVRDICEFDVPTRSDTTSWTALTKSCDLAKRALLLRLSEQIDQLAAGEIDEIVLFVAG